MPLFELKETQSVVQIYRVYANTEEEAVDVLNAMVPHIYQRYNGPAKLDVLLVPANAAENLALASCA